MELKELENQFVIMGMDFARQWNIDFYKQIDRSLKNAGREVHHGSSPKDLLSVLDSMWFEFDGPMRPRWPKIVCGSEAYEKIKTSLDELTTNPELRLQLADLIKRKYREWSDREAAKHLAD
ncbi:hypothetical protein LBMAG53_39590 [Planctomycetota bacterium]|nr:hypothetical protein LBMAG53_39590 [Planctomycetota bacterium]